MLLANSYRFTAGKEAAVVSVSHYRDEQNDEVDAVVELPDGRWSVKCALAHRHLKAHPLSPLHWGPSHTESRGIMRTRPWTTTIAGAAALLMLAGCSSESPLDGVESRQIDWDVAVTRTAILFGHDNGLQFYSPWTNEIVDRLNHESTEPVTDQIIDDGLELLCSYFEAAVDDPALAQEARLPLRFAVREAVNAVVLNSASEGFREQRDVWHKNHPAIVGGSQLPQEAVDAFDVLSTDYYDEWLELRELELELEQQVSTLESARDAESAIAERCDVPAGSFDFTDTPVYPPYPALVDEPMGPGDN